MQCIKWIHRHFAPAVLMAQVGTIGTYLPLINNNLLRNHIFRIPFFNVCLSFRNFMNTCFWKKSFVRKYNFVDKSKQVLICSPFAINVEVRTFPYWLSWDVQSFFHKNQSTWSRDNPAFHTCFYEPFVFVWWQISFNNNESSTYC